MFQQIRDWAEERGLYAKGSATTQYIKLQEECGELAKALLKNAEVYQLVQKANFYGINVDGISVAEDQPIGGCDHTDFKGGCFIGS